ncbi:MAG: GlxA family transcriptional regulator [Rhodospirillales bacterium]|nr:GlxA family transcriptional regulator [Rhodospirillales bacterium]
MTDAAPSGAEGPQTYGFFLVPRFAMMAFTSAIEPLRAANLLSGRKLYDWRIISRDGAPVASSNGTALVAQASIESAGKPENLIVCSGLDAHLFDDRKVLGWLRDAAHRGARLGALSDGSFILARAGLLEGFRCTIHWNCLDSFAETFPEIEVSAELYRIDRKRFTCAGGTAAFDMMLNILEQDHGRALAVAVAEQYMHDRIRGDADRQRISLRLRIGASNPRLLEVIALMEENLELPLSGAELARESGMSKRQLERLFRRYLGRPPMQYYMELRLQRAHQLLNNTSMSVLEVGVACGFASASHFAKRYRDLYHHTPRSTRLRPAGA